MRIYQLLAIAALCAVVSVSSFSISIDDGRKYQAIQMMDDPLFKGFSLNQLVEILKASEELWVPKGTVVLRQGEPSKSFYIIAVGAFDVFVGSKKARTLRMPESFGELGLLGDGIATATVVATKQGRFFSLDKQSFNKLVAKHVKSKDSIFKAKQYI